MTWSQVPVGPCNVWSTSRAAVSENCSVDWGLQMIAAGDNLPRWEVMDRQEFVQLLTGTALSWSDPVRSDGMLTIMSAGDCRLQVTVLSGDGGRPGTLQK